MTNLAGVLYWVSLNDFDVKSEEDTFETKMHESIDVFKSLVYAEETADLAVVLFLNKKVHKQTKQAQRPGSY